MRCSTSWALAPEDADAFKASQAARLRRGKVREPGGRLRRGIELKPVAKPPFRRQPERRRETPPSACNPGYCACHSANCARGIALGRLRRLSL